MKGFHVGPFRSKIQHHPTLYLRLYVYLILTYLCHLYYRNKIYMILVDLRVERFGHECPPTRLDRRKYKKKRGRNERSYNPCSSVSAEGGICAICGLNDTLRRYEGMKGFDLEDTYVKPFHQPRREIIERSPFHTLRPLLTRIPFRRTDPCLIDKQIAWFVRNNYCFGNERLIIDAETKHGGYLS